MGRKRKLRIFIAFIIILALMTSMVFAVDEASKQPTDIGESIAIGDIPPVTYNGRQQRPALVITGDKLAEGTDYTVTYGENINAGIGTVIVEGLGHYAGTLTKNFEIIPAAASPSVSLSKTTYIWNGKERKPSVTVKIGKTALASSEYTLTWPKDLRNVGTHTVTVTLKGNYTGEKSASYKIVPKGTSISKLTSSAGSFKVAWTVQSEKMSSARITGYQLQYCTNGAFESKAKTLTIKGYSKKTCNVKDLRANTTYYVRIRTYTKSGKKNYYSAWSKAKTVHTALDPSYRPRILVLDDNYEQGIADILNKNGCDAEILWTKYIDVSRYDGLVIPGGHNIDPRMYGAERAPETYGTNIKKDKIQVYMIQQFAKANKPVLGVCRGCQVVNVAFGGTICQHIPGWHKWDRTVKIKKGSWLYNAYGSKASTYHFHHQCVQKLGDGLVATQWDVSDGRIEAIEHKTLPVYGVQWHPDAMETRGYGVFREFRNTCVRYKKVNDYKRTPHKPAIKKITANGRSVKIQWNSARNAKKYKLLVQTGDDGWEYRKTVTYRGENRERYSDSLKYKLVRSGNKYKVYVRKNPYKEVKTLSVTEYTFKGKYGKKYTFVIQAINGVVHSDYSAVKTISIKKK